jgi:hypothetical protein
MNLLVFLIVCAAVGVGAIEGRALLLRRYHRGPRRVAPITPQAPNKPTGPHRPPHPGSYDDDGVLLLLDEYHD